MCATLTVHKPTSILSVLPMEGLTIMRVRSKRHHVRNRRKLKSCLWADVKVMLLAKFSWKIALRFYSVVFKRKRTGTEGAAMNYCSIRHSLRFP